MQQARCGHPALYEAAAEASCGVTRPLAHRRISENPHREAAGSQRAHKMYGGAWRRRGVKLRNAEISVPRRRALRAASAISLSQ